MRRLALLLLLAVPAGAVTQRSVEWIEKADMRTKIIREDGVEVYRNTWVKTITGRILELGPGVIPRGKPASAPPRPAVAPKPPAPAKPPVSAPKPPAPAKPPVRPMPPAPPPPARPVVEAPAKPAPPAAPQRPSTEARAVALALVGSKFKYAGRDPATGLDGPGLVWAFFQRMGVEVSPQVRALWAVGEPVGRDAVKAGDLVFFTASESPEPNVAGIALGDGGMVYVSSSKGSVQRAEIASAYWKGMWHGAKRILGTKYARPKGGSPWVEPAKRAFEGVASYYGCGDGFDRSGTASGERYDKTLLTAAHRELPFGTRLRVTHGKTGKSTVVRINDRGPFVEGRVLDLSCRAASEIGMMGQGLARVRCQVVE